MKHILKEGKLSILLPEREGGALSGEVYLIKHNGKKYVVRRCSNLPKAKYYESISKKLEKYDFLPKLLGRFGKDVLYEFIEGRDLRRNEKSFVFEQLGEIGAFVNKQKIESNPNFKFNKTLRELISGKYVQSPKVLMRRKRSNIRKKPKAVLSSKEANKIKKLYSYLMRKTKAKIRMDISDFVPGNFRLRKGKVYLVDVESIKSVIKGRGIAKCFRGFCNTEKRKELFIKGYTNISSMDFLDETYLDLCHLLFAVQALHFKVQVNRDSKEDLEKIETLLKKYKI
ncbi:MAG: hypothetical protein U9Q06_00505 [Nanoarchaeota archaeon]|nr:hypothetical protein [Nanoarchaeota archaeon]